MKELGLFRRILPTKVYRPGMYKGLPKRLNWEQIEAKPRQEGKNVIKGTSKRVVVVKNPDPKIFEQAIFIVREDFLRHADRNQGDILREAQQVADHYIKSTVLPPRRGLPLFRLPPALFAACGVLLTAGVWLALHLANII